MLLCFQWHKLLEKLKKLKFATFMTFLATSPPIIVYSFGVKLANVAPPPPTRSLLQAFLMHVFYNSNFNTKTLLFWHILRPGLSLFHILGRLKGAFIYDVTQFWALITQPSPSAMLKWVFYLHFHAVSQKYILAWRYLWMVPKGLLN